MMKDQVPDELELILRDAVFMWRNYEKQWYASEYRKEACTSYFAWRIDEYYKGRNQKYEQSIT